MALCHVRKIIIQSKYGFVPLSTLYNHNHRSQYLINSHSQFLRLPPPNAHIYHTHKTRSVSSTIWYKHESQSCQTLIPREASLSTRQPSLLNEEEQNHFNYELSSVHVRILDTGPKSILESHLFDVYVCMSLDTFQSCFSDTFVWKQLETSGKHLQQVMYVTVALERN